MRIIQESVLPAPKEVVTKLLQRSDTLCRVAKGFVTFEGELPELWRIGELVELRPRLFGVLPPGSHRVTFTEINPDQGFFQTREVGKPFSRWEHTMLVGSIDNSHCSYIDIIDCEAGLLNPVAGRFVKKFYQHRHQRWLSLLGDVKIAA